MPIGRVRVKERGGARLLDDLSSWGLAIRRQARDGNAVARLVQGERRLADAIFAVLVHDETPAHWQSVLLAAADIESIQSGGAGFKAGPIPPLSAGWLDAANDGTPEWRLACALASAASGYRWGRPHDPVRHHWLPLKRGGRHYEVRDKRLAKDTRVVASGRDAEGDLIALVSRRLVEASANGERRLPLVAARGFGAAPSDLAQLVAGRVNLTRTLTLARALMAVRWDGVAGGESTRSDLWPEESWMALRLACLPWALYSNRDIPVDDSIFGRLAADDAAAATETALRRLRASGLRPSLYAACAEPDTARRWAAAVAFPIERHVAQAMARRLDQNA